MYNLWNALLHTCHVKFVFFFLSLEHKFYLLTWFAFGYSHYTCFVFILYFSAVYWAWLAGVFFSFL